MHSRASLHRGLQAHPIRRVPGKITRGNTLLVSFDPEFCPQAKDAVCAEHGIMTEASGGVNSASPECGREGARGRPGNTAGRRGVFAEFLGLAARLYGAGSLAATERT